MAQFASDAFGGSSGTELSTYNSSWTEHTSYSSGNLVISDAGRVRRDTNNVSAYYHSGSPASADYSVSATLFCKTDDGGGSAVGVMGRVDTGAHTMYTGRYNGSTTDAWQLYKIIAGTATQLGSSVSQSLSDETGYAIKLEMVGTAIKLFKEGSGSPSISVTDSSITNAGKAGIRFTNSTAETDTTGLHIDNFSADDIGGSATAVDSDLADSYAIRAAIGADLADSYAIRAAIGADFADSYAVLSSVAADLADSYAITASVNADLADSYLIRASVAQDLADSYALRASIASDLADSYTIENAGTVSSDLADSYLIRVAIASDLSDSAAIRTAVLADIADEYTVRSSVSQDLADQYTMIGSVQSDLDDSYIIRAAVAQDLIDSYTVFSGSGTGATAEEIWAVVMDGSLTASEMMRIMFAALAGKREGIGTATERYYGQDGTTPRITLTPDQYGNGTPVVDGS